MYCSKNPHARSADIQNLPVWDPLVRIIHWTIVAAILTNGFLNDPESEFHEYIGYAALSLVVLRLVWGVVGPVHARFSAFPPNPLAAIRHIRKTFAGNATHHLSHNPLGALMVYNIWATILLICTTGIMMGTVRFFGVEWVKKAHEAAFYWLMVSVVLHIAGVFTETWLSGVPLVKAMIDGRKRISVSRKVE